MKRRSILRSYSSIITKNIPLFLTAGILNIFFSDFGLFPNPVMEQASRLLVQAVIPLMIGYTAGKKCGFGETAGGLAGAAAVAGLIVSNTSSSIIGAVFVGAMFGRLAVLGYRKAERHLSSGFEMMARQLTVGAAGLAGIFFSYYAVVPALTAVHGILSLCMDFLIGRKLLMTANILIEPLKIVFLNNWINHGVLIPLGLEQMQTMGQSVMFLLEVNPGPGFGILLACYITCRERRDEIGSSMVIQLFGGIHEVYFPYVLSNLKLLAAAIAGGIAGTACFLLLGTGIQGPVSPGSILTILMMARPGQWLPVIAGICVSAAVSCAAALILKGNGMEMEDNSALTEETAGFTEAEETVSPEENAIPCIINHIYVICDAGLGSSAMGAALLRRRMKEEGLEGILVRPAAADEIPDDADLLVCQKDFYHVGLKDCDIPVVQVDKLTDKDGYQKLILQIKERT